MGRFNAYVTKTVVEDSGEVLTKVATRPVKGETEEARIARLAWQAGQNHIKTRHNGDGYKVSSQQKPASGTRKQHEVTKDAAGQWHCDCEWHQYHPHVACSHIAAAMHREERDAKAQRVEARIAEAAASFKALRGEQRWTEEV